MSTFDVFWLLVSSLLRVQISYKLLPLYQIPSVKSEGSPRAVEFFTDLEANSAFCLCWAIQLFNLDSTFAYPWWYCLFHVVTNQALLFDCVLLISAWIGCKFKYFILYFQKFGKQGLYFNPWNFCYLRSSAKGEMFGCWRWVRSRHYGPWWTTSP